MTQKQRLDRLTELTYKPILRESQQKLGDRVFVGMVFGFALMFAFAITIFGI